MNGPLKLRAKDDDDLAVLAACLQDALVPIGDMTFLPQEQRFVLVANRFRWEARGEPVPDAPREARDAAFEDGNGKSYERTNCGVWFEGVRTVRTRGIDLRDRSRILDLLTLRRSDDGILLIFAGGATIRLETDGFACFLEDIGESWPTRWRPGHGLSTGGEPSA